MPGDSHTFDDQITLVDIEPYLVEGGRSLMVYHQDGVDVIPLVPGVPMVLGRGASADLVLRGAHLSRRHARFELVDGLVWISDLNSTNGTNVNGELVGEPRKLSVDDECRLGSIFVAVTSLSAIDARRYGMASHDQFMNELEREVTRSSTFGRPMAVLMVQAAADEPEQLHKWSQRVRALLREVDTVGLYGPTMVEIVLAEADLSTARGIAEKMLRNNPTHAPILGFGIAVYPDAGRTPEELSAAARVALQGATEPQPIRIAGHSQRVARIRADSEMDGDAPVLRSPAMVELYQTSSRIAAASIPILILGETGTGKEILARFIHAQSSRSDQPMHCINCGAIPQNLIESVLFGYEKGAFTGADRQSKGIFEEADGGTVLFDEIGELPLAAQVTLLRVLDTQRVQRVGTSKEIEVDVRVLASTHRDLEAMCERGEFRLDLLFRINTMTLKIPPLRERLADVQAMAHHFLDRANSEYDRNVDGITSSAVAQLMKHPWPGNVRELRNVIDRAVLICIGNSVTIDDLPERLRHRPATLRRDVGRGAPAVLFPERDEDAEDTIVPIRGREFGSANFKYYISACEVALIRSALAKTGGNQTRAAEMLQLPRRTFVYKLRTYNIEGGGADHESASILAQMSESADKELTFKERIERIESRLIEAALSDHAGDPVEAARKLGLHKRTFDAKARKFGLL